MVKSLEWKSLIIPFTHSLLLTQIFNVVMVIRLFTKKERPTTTMEKVPLSQQVWKLQFLQEEQFFWPCSSFHYSHLSNKRGAHAYRFWKIPPSTKKKFPLQVYWFHKFIPTSTFIPASTFSDLAILLQCTVIYLIIWKISPSTK